MRILSRHFLASYLGLFAAILLTSIAAIAIIELLLNFDDILGDQQSFRDVAHYLFLRIPGYYFRDLIPVASFAAAFFCVGLAARRQEITAVKAGGVSPRRTVAPLWIAALLLAAAALLLNDTIVRAAIRESNRLANPGAEISFRRGSFWVHRGDAIYNVSEADRTNNTLHGVRVFAMDERGRLRRTIVSDLAEVGDDHRWHLRDATVRTFEPGSPTAAPRVEHSQEAVVAPVPESDLELLEAGAANLTLAQLAEYIRVRAGEGADVSRYAGIVHTRLADAASVLVFALVAVPLGFSVERSRSLASAAVVAIVLLGIFYSVRTAAAMAAAGGAASPVLAPWWALGGFAALAGVQLARVEQ